MTHGYEWFLEYDFVDLDDGFDYDYDYQQDYNDYMLEDYEQEFYGF